MSQPWLSYEHAPPLWLPCSFFMAAMCWLTGLPVLLWWSGASVLSRFQPETLALVHLMALGVLGNIMFGALIQLLAVLAGIPVMRPLRMLILTGLLWQAGVACLVFGFVRGADPVWLQAGALLAGFAAGVLLCHGLRGLLQSPARDSGSLGMRRALQALAVALVLGAAMVCVLAGRLDWPLQALLDAHVLWAGIGWLLGLLLAISQTVVPMFLITPPLSAQVGQLGRGVLPLLCLASLLPVFLPAASVLVYCAVALVVLLFVARVWQALAHGRRRHDPVRRQWQVAMLSFFMAVPAALMAMRCPQDSGWPLLSGVLWLGGGLGVMLAMLCKIVPFLIWLALQRLDPVPGSLPHTHALLGEPAQVRLGWLHQAWLAGGVWWSVRPQSGMWLFAGLSLVLALCGLWLGLRLVWQYRRIRTRLQMVRGEPEV